jgi:predicted nucleic acid-binding protein
MTALDASVCVPALISWHEHHDACRAAAIDAYIPAHALTETYAVLTRLPAPHRLEGSFVARLLTARFGSRAVLPAPARLQRELVAALSTSGIEGGATYDALIGLTARHHGEVLLTRDVRATRTYEALAVPFRLVD